MTVRGERDPLPYYQWFVKDYRANRKVQAMNYVERGLYRELLDECWEEGRIPDDPLALADICQCPVGVMAEAWPKIRKCFTPLPGMDGMFLTNDKLESLRHKADKIRNAASVAGRMSAEARRNGRSTVVNGRQPTEQNRTEQSSSRPSAASPLEGASASGDEPASPEQIRAILDNLKNFGGGGR